MIEKRIFNTECKIVFKAIPDIGCVISNMGVKTGNIHKIDFEFLAYVIHHLSLSLWIVQLVHHAPQRVRHIRNY